MASDPTDAFLTAVARSGLLAPAETEEFTRWAAAARPDPTAAGRELARRGWLTPFQIKEIYRGRGAELRVGPYLLIEPIGEGGMGRVYRARHTRLGRDVALKLIRKERLTNPQTVRRFHQEVRAAAALSHPNVVLALDADEVNGHHFFAMEYVDGLDLARVVRDRGPLPAAEACGYAVQAALGLQHAHERGLVHRDVKPSNFIVTRAGQVKVLDLGLAMLHESPAGEEAGRVTIEGYVLGTPDFVAPEQARDPQTVDARADIYALGATLFFLLTGQPPYPGGSATEKLLRHVTDPPPDLLPVRPDAPPGLDAVLKAMMAKRPDDRPPTAAHAAAALRPFTAAGAADAPPAPDPSSQRFALPADGPPVRPVPRATRRGMLPLAAAVAGAAAVLAGLIALVAMQLGPTADRPPEPEYMNALDMRLVLAPGGTFRMGSAAGEPGRSPDEGPAGEVTIDGPFYAGVTEVTNAQYAAVVGRTPSAAARRARQAAELPVESVTWDEAREFCRRLSEREAKRRRGWAYRLPTEAEWEYAARAGTATAFPFGDRVIAGRQAVLRPTPRNPFLADELPSPPTIPGRVGATEPNRFGLCDTAGNVAEWCSDWYAAGYPPDPRQNPTGPATGDLRVVRGGGWDEPAARCRSAARRGLPPDTRDAAVGFRVVLAAAGGG